MLCVEGTARKVAAADFQRGNSALAIVGFEDNLFLSKGVLAPSNAALVVRARQIIEAIGGQIASTRDAREILGLRK